MGDDLLLARRGLSFQTPVISVLMSVCNGEKYLHEAIQSIINQTFPYFELILLDDGSSDRSLEIIKTFANLDSRIRVISRENQGLVASLNEMILISKAPFLARMDADDISLPKRFEKQIEFLRSHEDVAVVGTAFLQIDAEGNKIGPIICPLDHESIESQLLRGNCAISHPSVMVRASAMAEAGGYRAEFPCAQDLDLWLRITEFGRLANISDILIQYRIHPNSISEASGAKQRELMTRAVYDAWARRGIKGELDESRHWRAGSSRLSKLEFTLNYGWVAWSHGYRETWLIYALKALKLAPWSIKSWKLVIFGFLKRPKSYTGQA